MERIHNLEFEQQALSCVLINPAVWKETGLKPVLFYDQRHIRIAAAIERLIRAGAEVDYLTICNELKKHDALDDAGGPAYLTQLNNEATSSLNAPYYGTKEQNTASRLYVSRGDFPPSEQIRKADREARTRPS